MQNKPWPDALLPLHDPRQCDQERRENDREVYSQRQVKEGQPCGVHKVGVLAMLPLFAHVDDTRVRAAIDDPLIKARPTLHYRLPNCEIDREHWGIHLAWRDWLEVEKLAADRARLDRWCAHYADRIDADRADPTDWANETEAWLLSR